jgi:hypothetical protein
MASSSRCRILRCECESVAFLGMLNTRHTGHLRFLHSEQTPRQRLPTNGIAFCILRAVSAPAIRALKGKLEERGLHMWNDLTGLTCGALTGRAAPGPGVPDRYGGTRLERACRWKEVHRIPRSHLNLIREPNVRFLGQESSACLARCRFEVATSASPLALG